MAGISEEMFFRGFLYLVTEKYSDPLFATLISSLIFGIAHFPFTFGPPALVEACIGNL